jgi:hypothetical protein
LDSSIGYKFFLANLEINFLLEDLADPLFVSDPTWDLFSAGLTATGGFDAFPSHCFLALVGEFFLVFLGATFFCEFDTHELTA